MKCEVCLKLLEEYLDSELAEHEAEQVSAHLITCVGCASELDGLTAEQEIYSRYDRALDIAPSMWGAIAARTTPESGVIDSGSQHSWRDRIAGFFAAPSLGWSFSWSLGSALAVLLVAVVIGVAYLSMNRQPVKEAVVSVIRNEPAKPPVADRSEKPQIESSGRETLGSKRPVPVRIPVNVSPKKSSPLESGGANQSDVVSPDIAYSTVEEQETQKHIEQAQNLLRSVRNIEFSEDDIEIDVTYEKALSRQLLNENVVLRRDAEMSGKFPVKTLLSSLEPFLLDIANLPDKTSPDDLRVIKERVEKTEIVAALHSY